MKTNSLQKGFTVLEFLIVIAMMTVLVGLILVGLTAARKNSRDQARVSNIQNVVVGLTQFYDICREYPPTLDSTIVYDCLDNKPFTSLVSDVDKFQFNAGSEYYYVALADLSDPDTCTGFHIGVTLEGSSTSFANSKTGAPASSEVCNGTTIVDFDGTQPNVFDIRK